MNQRVLGKGLEALIPKKSSQQLPQEFVYLSVDSIQLGKYQPRQKIDAVELAELSHSIQEKGFIQPILVRKIVDDRFELVAGYRRLEAAKLLSIKEIPTLVKEINDRDAFMLAITENLQRKDLNPLEEARAFKRLIDEFDLTQEEIGRFLGKDRSSIANTLRLLKLPADIQQALGKGLITRTQARTILSLGREQEQRKLFQRILKQGLSVRELEKRVKKTYHPRVKPDNPFLRDIEERFQKALGTRVVILNKRNNQGKIVIERSEEHTSELQSH